VTREQFQHVVEETDPRGDFVFAPTFDGERKPDIGFRGGAM